MKKLKFLAFYIGVFSVILMNNLNAQVILKLPELNDTKIIKLSSIDEYYRLHVKPSNNVDLLYKQIDFTPLAIEAKFCKKVIVSQSLTTQI